jgi:uncharacterized protein
MTEASLEHLSYEQCLALLRENSVGRIGFVIDDMPAVLPVNYRLVESRGITPGTWIALRTRPGNVIDQGSTTVAFEIDGSDPSQRQGWSVLVRGTLHRVDAAAVRERFDPDPWLAERDAWMIVDPFAISGRRLDPQELGWALDDRGYA